MTNIMKTLDDTTFNILKERNVSEKDIELLAPNLNKLTNILKVSNGYAANSLTDNLNRILKKYKLKIVSKIYTQSYEIVDISEIVIW